MSDESIVRKLVMYVEETGQITGSAGMSWEEWRSIEDNPFSAVEGESDDGAAFYVLDGTVVPRPVFEARLDGRVLFGVPAGATVTIQGTDYVADGSDIELEFSSPGEFSIKVSMWPFMEQEFAYENFPSG